MLECCNSLLTKTYKYYFYKSTTKKIPAAMMAGTGCLLRNINDFSNETKKSCSHTPTVPRQKMQTKTGS